MVTQEKKMRSQLHDPSAFSAKENSRYRKLMEEIKPTLKKYSRVEMIKRLAKEKI